MKDVKNKSTVKNSGNLKRKNMLQLYTMCIIPVLLVFVFCYLPMFGIVIAFKDYRYGAGIFGSEWVGLKNFELFFKAKDFGAVVWNTISLNFMFIAIGMICAIIMAAVMYEVKRRNAVKTYQTILIMPNFVSWVVAGCVLYVFLSPEFGVLNDVLIKLGVEKIAWYSEPGYWPGILMISYLWKNLGIDLIMYYAAMMGIDPHLYEAAKIDGAGKIKEFFYITLPSLLPLIVVMFILKIGNIFRADFGLFYQLTRDSGLLYSTTDVMDTYIFRTMRVLGDMGISSAAGVLQSVVGFFTGIIVNCIVKKLDPDYALF